LGARYTSPFNKISEEGGGHVTKRRIKGQYERLLSVRLQALRRKKNKFKATGRGTRGKKKERRGCGQVAWASEEALARQSGWGKVRIRNKKEDREERDVAGGPKNRANASGVKRGHIEGD